MKQFYRHSLLILCCGLFFSCESIAQKKTESHNTDKKSFNQYWYAGKAEILSYELQQVRYGEVRDGEAILVFVTEDFLSKKQVKKESNTNAASTPILKLNFIRKFPTGIYDYSMMTSTFSPLNEKKFAFPIKSTTSSQEWCGHSWLQLNLKKDKYNFKSFSYFESEGDELGEVNKMVLEDAIWNQIRIDPKLIPEGEQRLIPSAHYLRFAHKKVKGYDANIVRSRYKEKDMQGEDLVQLRISYPSLNRELSIIYESNFPFKIVGWKESRNSWGKKMTTVARIKGELKSDYWSQNKNQDAHLKDSLKIK